MDHESIILKLAANRLVFAGLLAGVDKKEYLFRPAENKWCLLEIACHLHDEEREDFGYRLKHTLESPEKPLPGIDPEGWVSERNYMKKDYFKTVDAFLAEREQSVEWLRTLKSPNWKNAHNHPKFGPLPAEMFLSNWLAHDYLHIRQILRIKYNYLKDNVEDVKLKYAGKW